MLDKNKKHILHISLPGEIRLFSDMVKPPELKRNYLEDLLDPGRMSWDVLKEMEADLGQYGYAGQVGQRPTPPGGGMFKVDHFQIVDSIAGHSSIMTVRYWDKAGTQSGGCFTVGIKMGRMAGGKFIIYDMKRGQWSSEMREAIIRQTAEADGGNVVVYHEQEPGSGGKESAQSTTKNLAGFAAYADRPTGNKIYRADPYSVQVNNGNVYLLRGEWNKPFIDEHRYFPFSTYKDIVDSCSGAFIKLSRKKEAGPIIGKRI